MTMPRLLPHTIQLRTHCQQDPAALWVSRNSGQTARRPWCLSRQHLGQGADHTIPSDG